MRIPGLRTGMMKNPVGFAVRAALNDKSGSKSSSGRSSSIRSTSSRNTSTRRSSSYSSSGKKSSSSYSYSSGRSYSSHYSGTKSKPKLVSLADSEHNYSSFPNIFLNRGVIRAYGYTYQSAKNKAVSLAKEKFNASERNCKIIDMPCSPADSYKYGIEIVVDVESIKQEILSDKKRYSEVSIDIIFAEFKKLYCTKNYELFKRKVKKNKENIEIAKNALKLSVNNSDEISRLKEQSACYQAEVKKNQENIDKCSIFAFLKKQRFKKELKRIKGVLDEIENRIKELEEKQRSLSGPEVLENIINTLTLENKKMIEYGSVASGVYEYNYVKEEVLYAKLLDEYIISTLIKDDSQKELLLDDVRVKTFVENHPNVYNDLPNPNPIAIEEKKKMMDSKVKEDTIEAVKAIIQTVIPLKNQSSDLVEKNQEKSSNNPATPLINEEEKIKVVSETRDTEKHNESDRLDNRDNDIKEPVIIRQSSNTNTLKKIEKKEPEKKEEGTTGNRIVIETTTKTVLNTSKKKGTINNQDSSNNQSRMPKTTNRVTKAQKDLIREKMDQIIKEEYSTDDSFRDMFVVMPKDYKKVESCIAQASGYTKEDALNNAIKKVAKLYSTKENVIDAFYKTKQDCLYWAEAEVDIEAVIKDLEREIDKMGDEKYSEKRIQILFDDYFMYNFSIREMQYLDRMDYLKNTLTDVKDILKKLNGVHETDEFKKYVKELQNEITRINRKYLRCENKAANELFGERLYCSIKDPMVLKLLSETTDMRKILTDDPVINSRFPQSLTEAGLK